MLFVGIRVPSETPPVFVSEVANPAEVNRGIPQPFDPLTACLTGRWSTFTRHVGFHVCVDIAESAVEADVDPGELSGVVLGSVIEKRVALAGLAVDVKQVSVWVLGEVLEL